MAALTYPENAQKSQWLVLAAAVMALLVGFALKTSTVNQTKEIGVGRVTAQVPARWVVEIVSHGMISGPAADSNRVFTTWDPLNPGTRYIVSLLPASEAMDMPTAASYRNLERAQYLTTYRVIDQTPVSLAGREGYRTNFAFVEAREVDRVPVVFEGTEYFFSEDGLLLIVTLETSHDHEKELLKFREFVGQVILGDAK